VSLSPFPWLIHAPQKRHQTLLALWSAILEALVVATPPRDDSRVHVSDLVQERPEKITPEVARLLLDGVWKHKKWQFIMEKTGLVIATEQEITRGNLVGTPDHLLSVGGARVIFDVKSAGSGNFVRTRGGMPLPNHKSQLVQYLEIDQAAEFGVLLYENRDDLDLAMVVVERDSEYAQKLLAKRGMLNA